MKVVFFTLLIFLNSIITIAQYRIGITDFSVSLSDVKHGLPFYMLRPIHPGFEIEATFLKKEKGMKSHSFGMTAGYYYHSLIAHAQYLDVKYLYQRNLWDVISLNFHSGFGYLLNLYKGEGYKFNESTGFYESVVNTKSNFLVNVGLGLSYTGLDRYHLFVFYDINVHNVWAFSSFVNSTAMLKVGIRYNFKIKEG